MQENIGEMDTGWQVDQTRDTPEVMPPYTCAFIDKVKQDLALMMVENGIEDDGHPLYDALMDQLFYWDVIRSNITAVRNWGKARKNKV